MALTIPVNEIIERSKNPLLAKHEAWGRVPLREIATVQNGFAFKSKLFTKDKGIPLIRIRDVGKDGSETYYAGEYDPAYVVEPGDLLIGMDGDFNCARWRGPKGLLNQRVCRVTLNSDSFLPRLLDYTLPVYLKAINEVTSSVTVKHLSSKTVEDIPLPFPPIEQQKQIVEELDKQFSRLDEAVANLKRVKANLKRYKAAVLKAAVEGKLTAVNGQECGKSWKHQPIDVAIETLDQGWSPRCENEPSDSLTVWGVIKTTAVQSLRFLELENKRLPAKLKPRPHLELSAGDLLITRAGPRTRVGVACLVKATRPRLINCDKVYRLLAKSDIAIPAYLELVLNAPHIVDELDELKTGISDSGVNLTQKRFRELIIPIPPLAEQKRIVSEVERHLSIISEVELEVDTNLNRAERMRQSVLRNAFLGKR